MDKFKHDSNNFTIEKTKSVNWITFDNITVVIKSFESKSIAIIIINSINNINV